MQPVDAKAQADDALPSSANQAVRVCTQMSYERPDRKLKSCVLVRLMEGAGVVDRIVHHHRRGW